MHIYKNTRLLALVLLLVFLLLPQFSSSAPVKLKVLLTFDDGPDPNYTHQILEILAYYDIKALFFVLGSQVESHPEIMLQIVSGGHALGNHTFNHMDIQNLSPHELVKQIKRTDRAIENTAGLVPLYFRPPRGRYSDDNYKTLRSLGKVNVLWDLGLEKAAITDPHLLVSHLEARINGREELILLLHDGNVDGNDRSSTVEALPILIDNLLSMGFTFVDPSTEEGQLFLSRHTKD